MIFERKDISQIEGLIVVMVMVNIKWDKLFQEIQKWLDDRRKNESDHCYGPPTQETIFKADLPQNHLRTVTSFGCLLFSALFVNMPSV